MTEDKDIKLADNAFTELREGEEYQPVMSGHKTYPEVNGWSVTWGILMAVLFLLLQLIWDFALDKSSKPLYLLPLLLLGYRQLQNVTML